MPWIPKAQTRGPAGYNATGAAQDAAALAAFTRETAGPNAFADALKATYATVINAKAPRYGIKGDGVTDDTAAIQALFNGMADGTSVHFPVGTYLHQNLTIRGKKNFAITGDSAVFVATSRTSRYISIEACSDFIVRGITSSGKFPELRQGVTRGISIEDSARWSVSECHIFNTEGVGIASLRSTDGRIANCLIHNTRADGMHIAGASKRITISGNVLYETGDDSIAVVSYGTDTDACDDIAITGNVSWHSLSRGITIGGGRNITVSGNTIRDPRNAGIYAAYELSYKLRALENVTISGNTIKGANTYGPVTNYSGIHIAGDGGTAIPVTNVTVVGNTVEGSRINGILIGSAAAGIYGVTVASNTVRNSGINGVLIQRARDVNLTGNTIVGSGETGLTFLNTEGIVVVSSNIILDANRTSTAVTRRGVFIGSPNLTMATVFGNTIKDSTGASTQNLDFATSVNVMAFGNNIDGNIAGFPIASAPPFVVPGSMLVGGAFPSSGLGGGVGVMGIRNAHTVPTATPASGGILYVEAGALKFRGGSGTITTIGPA